MLRATSKIGILTHMKQYETRLKHVETFGEASSRKQAGKAMRGLADLGDIQIYSVVINFEQM